MKKSITNMELEKYIKIVSDTKSFRNNAEIKLPGSLDWSLRINLKKMEDIYSIYRSAQQELGQKYVTEGKTEDSVVKPEYINDYKLEMFELMSQATEIELTPLQVNDFVTLPLSMPEKDLLFFMCDDEDIKKYAKDNSKSEE